MRASEFSIIGLRLVSIYFILDYFEQIIQYVVMLANYRPDTSPSAAAVIGLAVGYTTLLIAAILIFVLAKGITNRLLLREETSTEVAATQGDALQSALFAGVGLLIFGLSINRTCYTVGQLIDELSIGPKYYTPPIMTGSWLTATGSTLQTLFGLFLFFGSRQVRKLWLRLRNWPAPTNG